MGAIILLSLSLFFSLSFNHSLRVSFKHSLWVFPISLSWTMCLSSCSYYSVNLSFSLILTICLSLFSLSLCLSFSLSVIILSPCVSLSVCLSVCLSLSLSISLSGPLIYHFVFPISVCTERGVQWQSILLPTVLHGAVVHVCTWMLMVLRGHLYMAWILAIGLGAYPSVNKPKCGMGPTGMRVPKPRMMTSLFCLLWKVVRKTKWVCLTWLADLR